MVNLLDQSIVSIINCVCQVVMATAALVAIFITLRQISSKSKIKVKIDSEFKIRESENKIATVEIVLHIANLGMACIYVSECGIQIKKSRHKKQIQRISQERFEIKPGDIYDVTNIYPNDEMNGKARPTNKILFYIKCHTDKLYYDKKKRIYSDFLHEYQEICKCADKANEEKKYKGNIPTYQAFLK